MKTQRQYIYIYIFIIYMQLIFSVIVLTKKTENVKSITSDFLIKIKADQSGVSVHE